MCRYGHHIYKYPYACFNCRKTFKQTSAWDTPAKQRVLEREIKCPQCGILMHNMGHDFKVPKQNNVKQ